MRIKTLRNKIVISETKNFDLRKSLECGQIFRYEILPDCFIVYETENKMVCRQNKGEIEIEAEDVDRALSYFDLMTDYEKMDKQIAKHGGIFEKAVKFGKGIRIFRQDILEMMISFVISANNNIPRIRKSLFKLCERFGEEKDGYFAFPTLDRLISITQKDWEKIGTGYRAKSLVKLCGQLKEMNFDELKALPTTTLKNKLISLAGIGPKVADCILLFAFSRQDSFPTDVWIKKFYQEDLHGTEEDAKKISEMLSSQFGHLSGLAQQYVYFYKREKADKN